MNKNNRVFRARRCWLLLALLTSPVANSQQQETERPDERQTRQASAVSQSVFNRIQEAQEAYAAEDYAVGLRLLDKLLDTDSLSGYERAQVLTFVGFGKFSVGDTPGAVSAYEGVLAAAELEPALRKRTLYTLAQLLSAEGRYTAAIERLNDWFALELNPAPHAYVLYAQNLYQIGNYAAMVTTLETAMDVARDRNMAVKEDWLVLLSYGYYQAEDYKQVRDIQVRLLSEWPRKRYWMTLAGAFSELEEARNLLAVYDLADLQGLLEEEAEFVTLAQLYLQDQVPYKAAQIMEREIRSGRLEKSASNYRLLSQAWTLARDDEKAIPPLKAAAVLEEDGELYARLGTAYLNLGRFAECEAALRDALDKGDLKYPGDAWLSLGICRYNRQNYAAALRAFFEARKSSRLETLARNWISVVRSDIARNEQIDSAEAAAVLRREELEQRQREDAGS